MDLEFQKDSIFYGKKKISSIVKQESFQMMFMLSTVKMKVTYIESLKKLKKLNIHLKKI